MRQTQKAPSWVMVGILAIIVLFTIPNIMLIAGLIAPDTISFSNEYGENVSSSSVSGGWMLYIIAILFYSFVTVLTFIKGWSKTVTVGAACLIFAQLIGLYLVTLCGNVSSYEELRYATEVQGILGYVETLIYITGYLLITFNSEISKLTKILFTVFILVFCLLNFIMTFFYVPAIADILPMARAICALALIYPCVALKPEN